MTLGRLFALATLALAIAGVAAFAAFFGASQRAIVARSTELREATATRVQERLSVELGTAKRALESVERAMQTGALAADPDAVEARLYTELLDRPTLSDLTLTRATSGPGSLSWQVSVFRVSADPASPVWTRRVRREGENLVGEVRRRTGPSAPVREAAFEAEPGTPTDPTEHATFEASVEPRNYGRVLWSDLAWSELDRTLPASERRVVLTAQKAVDEAPGRPGGVLRAGLLARTIDGLPALGVRDVDPGGPERAFLCDAEGRLIGRLDPRDGVALSGGNDLRVVPAAAPPAEIAAALAQPGRSGELEAGGERWLVTFRRLPDTQHWLVGVVAPEAYYTRDLRALRDRFVVALLALTAIALLAGAAAVRPVRRSLARVVETTARMRGFDLTPSPARAPLREVTDVMAGLEQAKTSMRALTRYVPMDLVRELHATNREPELGGELVELSMVFTDIEGFTSLSERLSPDELARALGLYLEAMAAGVRTTEGTVDKFIGDAVMAFWNAPRRLPDHAQRACRAALECMRRTRELYASAAWQARAPLVTRYGLHTARVMVGHFGAPERLSYTALGDGVNLAARLEPLCKQYGVTALASETTVAAAGAGFAFRLIDRVAVKGKAQAVRVYELAEEPCAAAATYGEGLEAYFARDFARAGEAFRAAPDDPPSRVMAARCAALALDPPPPGWDGIYVAKSK